MAVRHPAMTDEIIALLPRLRRFALTLTCTEDDADNILREACTRALGHAGQRDRDQPLDRWVFGILRNCWVSERQRRRVRLRAEDFRDMFRDDAESVYAHQEEVKEQESSNMINDLPADLGSILLIVSVEGYSYAEAAALFHVPKDTIAILVHRARKILSAQPGARRRLNHHA